MSLVLAAANDSPVPKDVVVAIFGAAAGVAGLVLVFLGVVVSAIGGFAGDVPDAVIKPFRRAAWYATGVFALGLVTVAASLLWLAVESSQGLYYATISLFAGLNIAALLLSLAVVREVV